MHIPPFGGRSQSDPEPFFFHAGAGHNLQSLFEDVLINFENETLPWKSATDWLLSDVNRVNSIIQKIVTLTQGAEIEEAKFTGAMIYQHLIIYIYAHLMVWANNGSILGSLKSTLQLWRSWDSVTMIESHQQIKDYLLDLHLQLHSELRSESTLRKVLHHDDIALCAHVAVMVNDNVKYKEVLGRRGPGAQALLNLLQARMCFAINPAYRSRHLKTLIRLSRASGLYPECLVLKGIDIEDNAVAGGSFGDVHMGRFNGQKIAVKILRVYQKSDMDNLLKKFSSETITWRQLSHPNVLPFYGVYHLDRNPRRVCLACPWMENGNVIQFLANRTSEVNCIPLCLDVAQGLEYLHSEHIIHGDLKGLNILVSSSQRACIADFGVATMIHSASMTYMTTDKRTRTLRWQAPELLPDITGGDFSNTELCNTTATDVYSFALVCYEMLSGNCPFFDIKNDFQFMALVKQGRRPSQPSHSLHQTRGLNDDMWHLMEACWITEPQRRLSASQITERMRALPNRPVDERPPDNFDVSFPSQVLCTQLKYPFSTLASTINDINGMGE